MTRGAATWAGYSVEVLEVMVAAVGGSPNGFASIAVVRSADTRIPTGDARFAVRESDLRYVRIPASNAPAPPSADGRSL